MPRSAPGSVTGFPSTSTSPAVGRMMRPQAGNQAQHGGFAAAGRPENRHELAPVRPVRHREGDVANHREAAETLGHTAKFHDAGELGGWWLHGRQSSTWR